MKKILLLAMLVVFGLNASNAQTKTKKKKVKKAIAAKVVTPKIPQVEGAGMLFDTDTIDYGTIAPDSDGNRKFEFVNNGNKPLVIESTNGSCGCTVPTKPDHAIAPGERSFIGVHYATDRAGQPFTKTVTVKSNATGQETKVLTIKGTVLPRPTAAPTPGAPVAEPTKS